MFGATILKLLPLFTSTMNCKVEFIVEGGILKFVGDDVKSGELVQIENVNNFTSIDEKSFKKLKCAKILRIKKCNCVPLLFEWVRNNMKGLVGLCLGENELTALPESIGSLSDLKMLYLHKNQLTSLPESIGKLVNLTRLDLSDNKLTEFPSVILDFLHNLKDLNLSRNQIASVPDSTVNLKHLEGLHLNGNKITKLPESFENMNQLNLLDLRGNPILDTSEDSLGKLQLLEIFYGQVLLD